VVNSYRTFIAIELPRDLRALIVAHIKTLRDELPDVRASWSREDNLHLTLKFLGNVLPSEISKVSDAAARAASTISPFELTVSGCGAFPPHGRPNVLWIGVGTPASGVQQSADSQSAIRNSQSTIGNSQSEIRNSKSAIPSSPLPLTPSPLAVLHSSLEDELAAAGFPREPRPFHPHLTIARIRNPKGTRPLAELHQRLGFPPQSFTVSEVIVFRSELLKEGSKHTAVSRHQLVPVSLDSES
jgi:2'-5' RNA ligase